jgi:hypothetical protein
LGRSSFLGFRRLRQCRGLFIFWKGIAKNQTLSLIERYKNDFTTETSNIEILEQVNLMTPENIHVNSFMYEPILDMSNDHLRKLYEDVLAMQ